MLYPPIASDHYFLPRFSRPDPAPCDICTHTVDTGAESWIEKRTVRRDTPIGGPYPLVLMHFSCFFKAIGPDTRMELQERMGDSGGPMCVGCLGSGWSEGSPGRACRGCGGTGNDRPLSAPLSAEIPDERVGS